MQAMDVTGGIGLKGTTRFQTAQHGIEVLLVSGEIGQRKGRMSRK